MWSPGHQPGQGAHSRKDVQRERSPRSTFANRAPLASPYGWEPFRFNGHGRGRQKGNPAETVWELIHSLDRIAADPARHHFDRREAAQRAAKLTADLEHAAKAPKDKLGRPPKASAA